MATPSAGPLRRLKWKIPVRLRHYWKLLAVTAATLTVISLVLSTVRIAPIVTSAVEEDDTITDNIAGNVDLFDTSASHEISVSYAEADYQRMLDVFWEDGEKEWIRADVTIDGTLIHDVAMRLKGNSTLAALTDAERGPRESGGPGSGGGPGGPPPGDIPDDVKKEMEKNGGPPGGPGGPGGKGGMPKGAELKTSQPQELPWLLDFDEFSEGRGYQGQDQLTLRVAGMGASDSLHEALALDLVEKSGEPTQDHNFTALNVNGGKSATRLIVDHPDVEYANDLGDGVLYKSLATSKFEYQGEALSEYADDFKQINKVGQRDVKPVVDFLQWMDEASDAEFASELDEWLDVDSFATYVALQNLLLNFDDMAGPGKNFYLWYDLSTEKFTVITWDLNLAMSGEPDLGATEEASMGPPGGKGGKGGGPPSGKDGGPGGGNVLKERFEKLDAFDEEYETAYRDLYQRLYADGTASKTLEEALDAAKRSGGDDIASLEKQATGLRELIDKRTAALAKDDVITAGD